MPSILGRVVATERRPNTTARVSNFWTRARFSGGNRDRSCGWTDATAVNGRCRLVRHRHRRLSGTDTRLPRCTTSWLRRHSERRITQPTDRAEIRLYTAAVLGTCPRNPLQPRADGTVVPGRRESDVAHRAAHGWLSQAGARTPGIPIGVYGTAGTDSGDLPHATSSSVPGGAAHLEHQRRIRAGDEDERGGVAAASRSSRTFRRRRGAWPRCAST
jgi:hypothetical protein